MADDRESPADGGPVGAGDYEVKPGDGMASIAEKHGFFADTLWNLPENDALRDARESPEVLTPGDRVTIPDLRAKTETRQTDLVHRFKRKGVPVEIRFAVIGPDGTPFPGKSYRLTVGKRRYEGVTDADGALRHWVAPSAESGELVIDLDEEGYPQTLTRHLKIGFLQPVSEIAGCQARLQNLGYFDGAIDGALSDALTAAVADFQAAEGLPADGTLDGATREALLDRHQH
ncbi:MAG: peptidoglycan-binding protein [Alphaproteobacteria bacterium]|nr:peptidoglycan-binding protein [Alphaproteobacteria bacterium]